MGDLLQAARANAGMTTEAAALATNIPRQHIAAMEANDVAALPPATFTRGFIRIYARVLQVPAEPILAAYGAALGTRTYAIAGPVRRARRRRRRAPWLVLGLLLLAGGAAALALVVTAPGRQDAPAAQPRASTAAVAAGSDLPAGATLELVALRATDLEITVDGRAVFDGPVTTGTRQQWAPRRVIVVRADAPDAVAVVVNRASIGTLGPPGGPSQRTWRVAAGPGS